MPPQAERCHSWLAVLGLALLPGLASAAPDPAKPDAPGLPVVYRWNAQDWLTKYNKVQFDASPITNADGTPGARVVITPRDANNPYNFVVASSANLVAGKEFTAMITFDVVEPTGFPTNFFMYARNSAGNQYDIWQTWIGLPGPTRTVCLPMDLKNIEGGKWSFAMGISKSGGLNIHSIVVYAGATSDGVTTFATIPPGQGAPATSTPVGVKEATGCGEIKVAPPAALKKTISTSDFKLTPDAPNASPQVAVDNAAALTQALAALKAAAPATLVFPKGVYRLAPVSAILFDGLTDVTIDGQGSTLIFEKLTKDGPAMQIRGCLRTALQNIAFDWDWDVTPIASLGVVSHLSADKMQCDFTFPDLTGAQTALTAKTPWRGAFAMDPQALYRLDDNIFHIDQKGITIAPGGAENMLHVTFAKATPLVDGTAYCIRHLYYEMGAFKIGTSTDLTMRNVDIHSMPGMGWFFSGGMKNFQLVDCHVARAPGSRHPLTTAADGIHADQFISGCNVERCSVTGAGDDAMNIHNESYQGTMAFDEGDKKKVTLLHCPSYQLRLNPGDPVEFYGNDFSQLTRNGVTTRVVAATTSDNKAKPPTTNIEFTEPLPAGLTAQSIVINGRYECSGVHIHDCTLLHTNGRGILLSAKNATVENNTLDYVFGDGINLESDIMPPLWTEGRGASNVLIKNNSFAHMNGEMRYNGAIIYANVRMPFGPTTATLYDGVTIENNKFNAIPGPVVSLTNCANLLVRGNDVTVAKDAGRYAGSLYLRLSRNLALGGNTWTDGTTAGVIYDPATTKDFSADGNKAVGK